MSSVFNASAPFRMLAFHESTVANTVNDVRSLKFSKALSPIFVTGILLILAGTVISVARLYPPRTVTVLFAASPVPVFTISYTRS